MQDFARREGYRNTQFFVDDGVSGTTFQREGFQQMQKMVEDGLIGTIIVKDLSLFGREQVEMGRLTQIVYPSLGVTFISIQENVNTAAKTGLEMMPFYNIFNEWYAEQTKMDLRLLMKALRDYTDIRQLTPEIVNALIRRIEVHSKDKETKKVRVDIYFTAVGLFTLPTEKELQSAMEEIHQNPQQFKFSA